MQIKDGEEPVHWAQESIPDTDFRPGDAPTSTGTIGPGVARMIPARRIAQ